MDMLRRMSASGVLMSGSLLLSAATASRIGVLVALGCSSWPGGDLAGTVDGAGDAGGPEGDPGGVPGGVGSLSEARGTEMADKADSLDMFIDSTPVSASGWVVVLL